MALPRGARQRATVVLERLRAEYPDVRCALVHADAFQLLAATILSAQSTDEMVNKTTPALFARYPTPADLAEADPDDVETLIRSTGFFRSKTKSLLGMAQALEDRFDGQVPTDLDDLVTLPGVGRKTANVVRSVAFDLPGLPVDTHVGRLARRLRLTAETDPVKAEHDLNRLVPEQERGRFSLRLIEHGRRVCLARSAPMRRLRPRRRVPERVQGVTCEMARSSARPAPSSERSAVNRSTATALSGVRSAASATATTRAVSSWSCARRVDSSARSEVLMPASLSGVARRGKAEGDAAPHGYDESPCCRVSTFVDSPETSDARSRHRRPHRSRSRSCARSSPMFAPAVTARSAT